METLCQVSLRFGIQKNLEASPGQSVIQRRFQEFPSSAPARWEY